MSTAFKVWLASALISTSFASFAQTAAKPAARAQAPPAAVAPPEQSFVCKDGSSMSAPTSKGACAGRKGIDKEATAKAAAEKTAAPAAGKAAPAVAAGSNAGKVWANESTKVYHCPGMQHYGSTKNGVYMTEADAKAKGMHAARNKACT